MRMNGYAVSFVREAQSAASMMSGGEAGRRAAATNATSNPEARASPHEMLV